MKKQALCFGLLAALALPAIASYRVLSEGEQIANAEVIAVVDVGPVKASERTLQDTTWHQQATATVEKLLKGEIPKTFTLYADTRKKCLPDSRLRPGKCLVSIKNRGQADAIWTTANAEMGIRPVVDGKIEWFATGERLQNIPLDEVVSKIVKKVKH
jgi:hypothetical protein